MNLVAWRIFHKRMPTKMNLDKRGIPLISLDCPLCNLYNEDETHLFRDCEVAKRTLKEICRWWGIPTSFCQEQPLLFGWGEALNLKYGKLKAFMGILFTFFWIIWKSRNGKVFSPLSQEKEALIFSQIQAQSFFWLNQRSGNQDFNRRWSNWCCSPESCF